MHPNGIKMQAHGAGPLGYTNETFDFPGEDCTGETEKDPLAVQEFRVFQIFICIKSGVTKAHFTTRQPRNIPLP